MRAVLTRISKFGFQTEEGGPDKWINLSKYEKGVSMDGFSKGDAVDYELNNKGYLVKLSKAAGGAQQSESGQQAQGGSQSKARSDDSGARGPRQTAVNAAFAAGLELFARAEGVSVEDALEKAEVLAIRLERFINTGDFNAKAEPAAEQK